jgi:hypothetical protein
LKLNEEERALFDAILAGCAGNAAMNGSNGSLAEDAAKRAKAFIEERRKNVEEDPS